MLGMPAAVVLRVLMSPVVVVAAVLATTGAVDVAVERKTRPKRCTACKQYNCHLNDKQRYANGRNLYDKEAIEPELFGNLEADQTNEFYDLPDCQLASYGDKRYGNVDLCVQQARCLSDGFCVFFGRYQSRKPDNGSEQSTRMENVEFHVVSVVVSVCRVLSVTEKVVDKDFCAGKKTTSVKGWCVQYLSGEDGVANLISEEERYMCYLSYWRTRSNGQRNGPVGSCVSLSVSLLFKNK